MDILNKKMKKQNIKTIKKILVPILQKNDIVRAGIFGSVARGEATKRSDIDILIQFRGRKSLLDLVHVKHEIEDKLKRKVDILTYKSINPLLKENILKEEVKIYERRR